MGSSLGCTDVMEQVVLLDAKPIKQQYYGVNSIIQGHNDKERDAMLAQRLLGE